MPSTPSSALVAVATARRAWEPAVCRGALLCGVLGSWLALCPARAQAESCTTQAKLSVEQRTAIGTTAFTLATAIQSGDNPRLRSLTIPEYVDSAQTAFVERSTGDRIAGDTLQVTQLYLLDAISRKQGETADAEFSCPLVGSTAETDFAISGLPPGRYAFAMVEAQGPRPYLLAFLLQHGSAGWKMAGFYPRERTVAGRFGLWYWTEARTDAKAGKPWLAWLRFGEADQLLRPAAFVSSTNLDRLLGEQRAAAPASLANGISLEAPLTVTGPRGAAFKLTALAAQGSDDGKTLNLVIHMEGDSVGGDAGAATERSVAAAGALLNTYPEIRDGFTGVLIFTDPRGGGNPFLVQRKMGEIPASK